MVVAGSKSQREGLSGRADHRLPTRLRPEISEPKGSKGDELALQSYASRARALTVACTDSK